MPRVAVLMSIWALVLLRGAQNAPASDAAVETPAISRIVVALKATTGDHDTRGAGSLTDDQVAKLRRESGLRLSGGSLRRDGSRILELARPMRLSELQPRLNAIRRLSYVLYADALPASVETTAASTLPEEEDQGEPSIGELIVKLRAPELGSSAAGDLALASAAVERLARIAGVTLTIDRPMSGGAHVVRFASPLSLSEAERIAIILEADPSVDYADPVTMVKPRLVPNDEFYSLQWHYYEALGGIGLPGAWDLTTGAPSLVVAVLDTGILFGHPDLIGRAVGGYDMISNPTMANDGGGRDPDASDPGDWSASGQCGAGNPPRDSSWHGTHVAGTIGAASNNGFGVAGVNWNSKILPIRGLGRCGGTIVDIADGIRWAAGLSVPGVPSNPNPARVINMSLGGPGACPSAMQDAINAALDSGTVVVVAAGNEATNALNSQPGNCNGVITVHGADRLGDDTPYSNVGSVVEISAPGGRRSFSPTACDTTSLDGVLSTKNSGTTAPGQDSYCYLQGTSMAAPHVAGVASLILSQNPSMTPSQVVARIQSTARPFPTGSSCNTSLCGAGIINAAAAISTSEGACVPSASTACLQNGRFRVQVSWLDFVGAGGSALLAPLGTPDSALFYFYGPNNWELVVKVLNGCGATGNGRYWVFGAAATTLQFTITVTDTKTGLVKQYNNPLGAEAPAITDTQAFATCP